MSYEYGELAEWFKALAWKACILQKGIKGSNPLLSAINVSDQSSKLPNYIDGSFTLETLMILPLKGNE